MDPDETMTTSTTSSPSLPDPTHDPEDIEEDDSLFPDNGHARTPANDHLNAAAPGELSPPRSQPHSDDSVPQTALNGTGQQANTSATRNHSRAHPGSAVLEEQKDETAAAPSANQVVERDDRPGWGWRNKKAQEEMQRAWDNIVDRDFSLKEYGDIILLRNAAEGQT